MRKALETLARVSTVNNDGQERIENVSDTRLMYMAREQARVPREQCVMGDVNKFLRNCKGTTHFFLLSRDFPARTAYRIKSTLND